MKTRNSSKFFFLSVITKVILILENKQGEPISLAITFVFRPEGETCFSVF